MPLGHRAEHDGGGAGVERARHGDLAFVVGLGEIGPRRRPALRRGVDRDAGRDELRSEIRAIGIDGTRLDAVDLRLRIGEQAAVLLERFHGRGIGKEQDVRLGLPGGELGRELGHHFGGSGTEYVDFDARVDLAEGGHGLRSVALGLRGVEDELAGGGLGVGGGSASQYAECKAGRSKDTTGVTEHLLGSASARVSEQTHYYPL